MISYYEHIYVTVGNVGTWGICWVGIVLVWVGRQYIIQRMSKHMTK